MEKTFAQEVEEGLTSSPKKLSSLYFYDDAGSRIFQEIMAMPEYYLTNCEFEILQTQSKNIYNKLNFNGHFNVVEMGAGDGLKTKEMLRTFLDMNLNFTYIPVDVSAEALDLLTSNFKGHLNGLDMQPLVGNYFEVLHKIVAEGSPNLILFLGANIGNFEIPYATNLLRDIEQQMQHGDKLLVGFDLQKNPRLIQAAYDDSQGITKRFNMNLLARMNRELDANFNLDDFDFYSTYNPLNGEVRSGLVSLKEQVVNIGAIGRSFQFGRGEMIYNELSRKYTLQEISDLGSHADLQTIENFLDCKHYFTDTLFAKI